MKTEVVPTRRWEDVREWIHDYTRTHTPAAVADMLLHLASNVSAPLLEDLFRAEMQADGYFDELYEEPLHQTDAGWERKITIVER